MTISKCPSTLGTCSLTVGGSFLTMPPNSDAHLLRYIHLLRSGTLHPTLVRDFSLANLTRTLSFIGMNINLTIYDQWHQAWFYARRHGMVKPT
jgi:hypothetical protein